jgi:hypothetical protein
MKQGGLTASAIGMLCTVGALLAGAGSAFAAPPLLPPRAFQTPEACMLEPFADASIEQHEQQLSRKSCGLDRLQMRVATPRVRPLDTGPSRVEVEVDQLVTLRAHDLTASARLGWAGSSQEDRPRLQTDRAVVAAGGLWRLDDQWAMAMKVGCDLGASLRTRATLLGLYRPEQRNLLFMQLAAEQAGLAPAIGMRWWLDRHASFDLMARRAPDGGAVEPRFALQILGFGR